MCSCLSLSLYRDIDQPVLNWIIDPFFYLNISQALPFSNRPLFCSHMTQLIICFTGFTQKEELKRLADLVHHMGGSIRKDFSSRVTHLVANATSGNKYRVSQNCWRFFPLMVFMFVCFLILIGNNVEKQMSLLFATDWVTLMELGHLI